MTPPTDPTPTSDKKTAGGGAAPQKAPAPPAPPAHSPPDPPKSVDPADLLKSILAAQRKTASLQSDYVAASQNVPNVLGVAAEILKKKEASEQAMTEGMSVVEKVLKEACDKAEALSQAMKEQHDALSHLLTSDGAVLKLLANKDSELLPEMSKIEDLAAAASAAKAAKLALNDPQVAKLLNNLAGSVRTLLAKELQNKISAKLKH
ncbi:MAG: hypothetical protein HWE23_01255 [Rhodobacteraceae bacterium]|nr:hypothetical protein [Paracoccaceae bacterium]